MQGWTEPSSTLQPYALAMTLHNMTAKTGASATRPIKASASQYGIQGKRFTSNQKS